MEEIYVGEIHSVKDYFYNPLIKNEISYFEKLIVHTKNREKLILYRDILTSVLYTSESDTVNIGFNTKYVTNIRKIKRNSKEC